MDLRNPLLEAILCQIKNKSVDYATKFGLGILFPLPISLLSLVPIIIELKQKTYVALIISAWLVTVQIILIMPVDAVVRVVFIVLVTMSLLLLAYWDAARSKGAAPPWDPNSDTVLLVKMLSDNS